MSTTEALGLHLPKLPELDKDDIAAVRRFLPGKILGRVAALLSLALLVIGFTALVDSGLKRSLDIDLSSTPSLRFGLLLGLPILAVGSQLLVEWRAERSRRQMRALAVRTGVQQAGYFRIGPYLATAEDRSKFDRADGIHQKVLAWIEKAAEVPLYLTGDSGSGKSSVLNASVLPALRERGWTVIEARAWQDPVAALKREFLALPGRRSRAAEGASLRELIEAAWRRSEGKLLVVLDQFEEFIILGDPEQKRQFAALVSDLRSDPAHRLRLVLVIRSDYQSFLDELGLPALHYAVNFYQIPRFVFAAATDFFARSGLQLDPATLERLLTSAAELDETPGLVRPITLNVIGYVLAAGKPVAASLDAAQLVRRYIEQTVGQPAIRDFARPVLEQLVTEQSTKRPRSEQEIASATRLRHGEVRAVLNGLGDAGLARPLDAAQEIWELSHDFVARAVSRHLGRQRSGRMFRTLPYAAPALLATIVAAIGGIVVWNSLRQDTIRSDVGSLGFSVASLPRGLPGAAPEGLVVVANPSSQITSENLAKAVPLLARLSNIQGLSLAMTGVHSIGPIEHLTALLALNLNNTKVENLGPLAHLDQLQSIYLNQTSVFDLRPLAKLVRLQELDLGGTKVESLEPLRGLAALRILTLYGTKVPDLAPLNGLAALQQLDLRATAVSNLKPLKGLTALQTLSLGGTKVANLEPLRSLARLRFLNLYGTAVDDLSPLRSLVALQTLNLHGTKVSSLEPVEDLASLHELYLSEAMPAAEIERFVRHRQDKKLPAVVLHPASD